MLLVKNKIRQLLTLAAVLTCLAVPNLASAQVPYGKALKAKRVGQAKLFAIQGVVAAGISLDATGQAEIKVFVTDDKVRGVPKMIDGVPVKRVKSGPFSAYQNRKQARGGNKGKPGSGGDDGGGDGGGEVVNDNPRTRFDRAVPIGVSIGATSPNYCFAGTLGCRLKGFNLTTGATDYFILSNNHVIANENSATPGFDLVLQPGSLDSGCTLSADDVIGTLYDFDTINFNGAANSVDAAIASTTPLETGFATPSTIYDAPTSGTLSASPGLVVKKFGRTTDLTEGVVDAINVDVNVGYDKGTAFFTDQIVIVGRTRRGRKYVTSSFSAGGDSGSLIVSADGNVPVGLLFAGSSSFTIANPIATVLDRFSSPNTNYLMTVDDGN